jgi:hypothetical protein
MTNVLDNGPFFHGTIADLRVGDLLTAGYRSNYRREVVMNHIYFTALVDGAGLAAEIAAELAEGEAIPRVYVVEPTGAYEKDPNVTTRNFLATRHGRIAAAHRESAELNKLRKARADVGVRIEGTCCSGGLTQFLGKANAAQQTVRGCVFPDRLDGERGPREQDAGCAPIGRNCMAPAFALRLPDRPRC